MFASFLFLACILFLGTSNILVLSFPLKRFHTDIDTTSNSEKVTTEEMQQQTNIDTMRFRTEDSWIHLQGLPIDDAVTQLSLSRPDLHVHKVPHGAMVTADFREDRVRVFYDKRTGEVVGTPRVG